MLAYLFILFISPLILLAVLLIPQFLWSFFQKPKLNKNFTKLFENLPEINLIENEKSQSYILIKNFRNATYFKSEWDNKVEWTNKKFNLDELTDLDIFIDNYGFLQSHGILIFNFRNDIEGIRKMCVSFEIRKTRPQGFRIWQALYKNIEAWYIVGSFDDLIGVRYLRRTRFKNLQSKNPETFKDLKILKTNFNRNEVIQILKSLTIDVNNYTREAKFYNFVYRNCLTEILKHLKVTKRFSFTFIQILNLENLLRNQKIIKQ
jgi:hypothetical protein